MPPKTISGRGGPFTSQECACFVQLTNKEQAIMKPQLDMACEKAGDLYRENTFLSHYRVGPKVQNMDFGVDKVQKGGNFNPKDPHDTVHPVRILRKEGLNVSRPVCSSQQYGWRKPIDNPKYGYERTRICQESFMDRSHLS
eukprot:GEMP01078602.1.p1 GENE.GEMP01078602.1~~GEMP01078602.1.p1  ORF type:complete len:141 (+),score=27.74 GEMP01078602.1:175-597(+)